MLAAVQPLAVRARRREALSRMVLLSVALHLALFLTLLIIPSPPLSTVASAPATVEVVAAAEETLPTPTEAPPTPAEAVPTAAVPPPPAPQAEAPPPPPPDQSEIAAPQPPPPPAPPPPQRVAARPAPTRPPPSRPPGVKAISAAGPPAHAQAASAGASQNTAWVGKLKDWWDAHSVYPPEASQLDQGGNVKVHIVIAADGEVTSIRVVQGSGSSVLDMAALAVFRNAHLPPFPPGTPAPQAEVEVSLHYLPAHQGG